MFKPKKKRGNISGSLSGTGRAQASNPDAAQPDHAQEADLKPIDPREICEKVRDLIGERKEKDLQDLVNDEHFREAFLQVKDAGHSSKKRGKNYDNIFHHLVKATRAWSQDDIEKVLRWLLRRESETQFKVNGAGQNQGTPMRRDRAFNALLLDPPGSYTDTPIHMAFGRHNTNPSFISALLRIDPPPTEVISALCEPLAEIGIGLSPERGDTCLHYAIEIPISDDEIQRIISLIKKEYESLDGFWNPLRLQQQVSGNTPLHLAVRKTGIASTGFWLQTIANLKNVEGSESDLSLIEDLVMACPDALKVTNNSGLTPYRERIYVLRGEENVREGILLFRYIKQRMGDFSSQVHSEGHVDENEKSPDESLLEIVKMTMVSLYQSINTSNEKDQHTPIRPHLHRSGVASIKDVLEGQAALDYNIFDFQARKILQEFRDSEHLEKLKLDDDEIFTSKEFRRIVVGDPIAEGLRNFCIRIMTPEEVMRCLYKPGEELTIDFNLAGISHQSILVDYLKSFESHLRFEATLSHVVLPKLSVQVAKDAKSRLLPQNASSLPPNLKGRTDLVHIFNWLRDRGVSKIIKVTVFDEDSPCHTDEAIRKCLEGFDIEVWDWRKIDISTEVIARSSGEIQKIYLYSSGNQAVLKGWASAGGFDDRDKFPEVGLIATLNYEPLIANIILCQLNSIKVYLREGQENTTTLNEYGKIFEADLTNTLRKSLTAQKFQGSEMLYTSREARKMSRNVNDLSELQAKLNEINSPLSRTVTGLDEDKSIHRENLKIKWQIDEYPYGILSGHNIGSLEWREHPRIAFLKDFATFLRNNQSNSLPAIKIAIIDDGLDSSFDILKTNYTHIAAGAAFCSAETNNIRSYYIPSGDHGARVASLICSICPRTALYIAKIEHEVERSGVTQINIQSATKAIIWAIQRGVNIINMSWTFETTSETSDEIQALKNAIRIAHEEGIIMFCAASDQGGDSKRFCFPAAWKEYCVSIGSLTQIDTPSIWLRPEQVQYMFPGEKLRVLNNDNTTKEDSGSSYATAVATGVAGLFMNCTSMLDIASSSTQPKNGNTSSHGTATLTWNFTQLCQFFDNLSKAHNRTQKPGTTRPEMIKDRLEEKLNQKFALAELDMNDEFKEALKEIIIEKMQPDATLQYFT